LLDADLRIESANAYFHALVGGTGIGRRFHDHLSVAGRIYLQTRLQQELALSGRVEELALDLIRADDRVRVPVMLNATQDLDDQGRPGVIRMAVWRAVARRAYEAEVPRARLAAQAAAAAKQDFLANISHEIRTPLNGVIGIAGALRMTALAPEQLAMVDMIVSSGAILERLVSDVLDLSKAQAGALTLELRDVDLRVELDGVVETARLAAAGKGLVFNYEVAPDARLLRNCDSVRIRQVLGNLLSNAIKFTAEGAVTLTIQEDDDALVFIVEDQGIGFDETVGDTLFQRFHQADTSITRRYGGSGLGLSICKSLVEQMGGDIRGRSRPGEGSLFRVRLPLAPGAAAPADRVRTDGDDLLAPLRILLVEDNPTNQKVVELILAASGVDLAIVDDGQMGVEAWRANAWDLILMDMQMPVMDGLTAVRRIREEESATGRPRTPIAMLSANAMPHHRQEGIDAGADVHIAKPITPGLLLAGIADAIANASGSGVQPAPTSVTDAGGDNQGKRDFGH